MNELNTPRLIGTPAGPGDFADLRRLHSDPRVTATLSADGATFSEEQTRAFLDRAAEHWKSHGFGLWIFREQPGGDFVGYGGIKHADVEGRDVIELAYAITSDHWRKGFATEISMAALQQAFDTMHLGSNRRLHPTAQQSVARRDGKLRLHLQSRHHPRQPPPRPLHPRSPRLRRPPERVLTGAKHRILFLILGAGVTPAAEV